MILWNPNLHLWNYGYLSWLFKSLLFLKEDIENNSDQLLKNNKVSLIMFIFASISINLFII